MTYNQLELQLGSNFVRRFDPIDSDSNFLIQAWALIQVEPALISKINSVNKKSELPEQKTFSFK